MLHITKIPAIEAVEKFILTAKSRKLINLENFTINLGGGLGLNYQRWRDDNGKKSPQPIDLLATTRGNKGTNYASNFLKLTHDNNIQIIFEPGRSLVANTTILVSKILGIKSNLTETKKFIISDLSMVECIRPSFYNSYHHLEMASYKIDIKPKKYDIVGPICESGDFVGLGRLVHYDCDGTSNETSDLMVLFDIGAYCGSMASNYNLKLRPLEVMVTKDDKIVVTARKEDLKDVFDRFE